MSWSYLCSLNSLMWSSLSLCRCFFKAYDDWRWEDWVSVLCSKYVSIIQCSCTLYRNHGGSGFFLKYHPKTSLRILLVNLALLVIHVGIAKPEMSSDQCNLAFHQIAMIIHWLSMMLSPKHNPTMDKPLYNIASSQSVCTEQAPH